MRLLGFILGGVLRYIGAGEVVYPLGNINPKYNWERKKLGKEKYIIVRYWVFHKQPVWAREMVELSDLGYGSVGKMPLCGWTFRMFSQYCLERPKGRLKQNFDLSLNTIKTRECTHALEQLVAGGAGLSSARYRSTRRSTRNSTCPSIPTGCALSVELVSESLFKRDSWKQIGRHSGARNTVASNLGADGRSTHTKGNAAGEQPNP